MNPQSDFFSTMYNYLEKGYLDGKVHGINNYTLGSMYASNRKKPNTKHAENEPPKTAPTHDKDKMWMRSGSEITYPKYKYPTTPMLRSDRKGIQHEMFSMLPKYKTWSPYQLSVELPKPGPAAPFQNEFADWRIEKSVDAPYIPPPPAKTTGVKHCKFCKKNGEHPDMYMSHQLFNGQELACPILATFNCTNCNQKGHTR